MRASQLLTSALTVPIISSLNILLSNDDSWATANIREFYKILRAAGHRILLVAPAVNQSGRGGTTVFTDSTSLTGPAEFDSVATGAPSFGFDHSNQDLWYYNGTPAACTLFALDYVVPKLWNTTTPDLFVAGPNEGSNPGPFFYTLSGTMGSTYTAIERGIPGITFSANHSTHRPYTAVNSTNDVAILNAKASMRLIDQLAGKSRYRILPLGYGLNVNLPLLNLSCSTPNYIWTRLTGGAGVAKAIFNSTSNLFNFGLELNAGVNACVNGDCNLPGETTISGCSVSVSVFTTDYDAPSYSHSKIRSVLQPLVVDQNSTNELDFRGL